MRFNIFEDAELGGLHHGSGADFDIFDPNKVGSANGMVYGWGFYLTTILDTAESYAHKSAAEQKNELRYKIRTLIQSYFHDNKIPFHLRSAFYDSVHVLDYESYLLGTKLIWSENTYEKIEHNIEDYVKDKAEYYTEEDLASLIDMLDRLYPDIEKHLKQWIDPIRYGIKLVKEGSDFNFIDFDAQVPKKDLRKVINQLNIEGFNYDLEKINDDLDGEDLCRYLRLNVSGITSKKDVSMFLLRAGFDGVSIDGAVYVIFDPNIIRIVEKTNV